MDNEALEQALVIAWARESVKYQDERIKALALRWLYAVPNSAHGKQGRGGALRGHVQSLLGLAKGVSDLCLPYPRFVLPHANDTTQYAAMTIGDGVFIPKTRIQFSAGLYIEMKHGRGKESEDQKAFAAYLSEAGYEYAVCYGWKHAAGMITAYMNLENYAPVSEETAWYVRALAQATAIPSRSRRVISKRRRA